jgi:hypothetical protein
LVFKTTPDPIYFIAIFPKASRFGQIMELKGFFINKFISKKYPIKKQALRENEWAFFISCRLEKGFVA